VAKAAQLHPDVIVTDVRMPQADGIEATRRVIALTPVPPLVALRTTFYLDEDVFDGLLAGATDLDQLTDRPPGQAMIIPSVKAGQARIIATTKPPWHADPAARRIPATANRLTARGVSSWLRRHASVCSAR
jgi:CheY-like chemotaxis protein